MLTNTLYHFSSLSSARLLITGFMSINCWLSKTEHDNPFADTIGGVNL
jgi:hypothetical protein